MPSATASVGVVIVTSRPSNEIVPESAGWMPAIVLTSVDLPAPLSPTRATTSPGRTSKSTSWSACTGPKLLLTPFSESTGVLPLSFIWLLPRMRTGAPRSGRPHSLPPGLLDAGRLAAGRVLAGADLVHRPELILDDRVLDLVLRDRHGRQEDRRHLLRAVVDLGVRRRRVLALGERHGELRRRLGLGLDRLVDGHVLLVHEDPLDRGELGVLPGRRPRLRVDAGRLHGRDRGAAGAVVGGIDAHEAVLADRGDRLLHLLLGLVRAPVGRVVLLRDLVAASVDHAVRALLEQLRVVVGGGAVDHDDGALGAILLELADQGVTLELADLLVVERDVVVDVGVRDQPVVADDRDLRLLRPVHDRAGGRCVHRVEHEHLRALRDRRLGLLLLLRRILVRVRVEDLAVRAEFLCLLLEVGPVLRLVAGGLRLGEEQRDRAATTAAVATTAASAAATVVVVAACRERHCAHECREDGEEPEPAHVTSSYLVAVCRLTAGAGPLHAGPAS